MYLTQSTMYLTHFSAGADLCDADAWCWSHPHPGGEAHCGQHGDPHRRRDLQRCRGLDHVHPGSSFSLVLDFLYHTNDVTQGFVTSLPYCFLNSEVSDNLSFFSQQNLFLIFML